jgi:putative transposase
VRSAWIAAERAEFTVAECCRALPRVGKRVLRLAAAARVSARCAGSAAADVDPRLAWGSRRAYGSPRVLEDLREQRVAISRKRVARLMQADGLKARIRKRFRSTT